MSVTNYPEGTYRISKGDNQLYKDGVPYIMQLYSLSECKRVLPIYKKRNKPKDNKIIIWLEKRIKQLEFMELIHGNSAPTH